MTRFVDSVAPVNLEGVHVTEEGYLQANVLSVRTGIQLYTGREVDPENKHGLRDRAVVRVYRSPEEVFHHDSIASFARKPLTVDHPTVDVTADNWKELAVGETDAEILRDGQSLRVPMTIRARKAITDVSLGKRQVSAGYSSVLDYNPGVTPAGEAFDVQQREIRANHIAIVDAGRAGDKHRIGDSAGAATSETGKIWGAAPIKDAEPKEKPMNTKIMLVDGLSVETTEAGAQAITKLQDSLKAAQETIATRDGELAKVQGELEKAQKAVPTAADLDATVEARAALLADARKIAVVDYKGLSAEDVRRKAVATKLGDAAVKDRSDAFVEVRFSDMVADADKANGKKDPVRQALSDGVTTHDSTSFDWGDVLKSNGFAK